jgi:hypothetical protein
MSKVISLSPLLAVLVSLFLGVAPGAAVAQTPRAYPQWGLLAEVVERDFHASGIVGKKNLFAFRWEEPGRKMSMLDVYGSQKVKLYFTLDPNSGKIIRDVEGKQAKKEVRLRLAADGSVFFEDENFPVLTQRRDGNYEFMTRTLFPTTPDTPAGVRAAELIAAGELRAPNLAPEASTAQTPIGVTASPSAPILVTSEIPRVPKTREELKASPWGALALLPGTLWYCVGHEPTQWLARRRIYQGEVGYLDESVPVMRLTVATWREPNRVLELITKLGDGRGWTDVITLQPDGKFSMVTTGVSGYSNVTGYKNDWGAVYFLLGKHRSPSSGSLFQNAIQFAPGYYGAKTSLLVDVVNQDPVDCHMMPFDKDKLPQWTSEMRQEQQNAIERIQGHLNARQEFAADHAAGQAMVAGMQADLIGAVLGGGGSGPVAYSPQSTRTLDGASASPFLQDLRNMADIAQRDAEASRLQLEASIAQGPNSGTTSSPATAGASGPSTNSAAAPAPVGASTAPAAGARTGYFACNQREIGSNTAYYSPAFSGPYDAHPERRYEAEFTAHLISRRLASGRTATCWGRLTEDEIQASILDSKRAHESSNGGKWIDVDWRPSSP